MCSPLVRPGSELRERRGRRAERKTHIKDKEDPIEVRPPAVDRLTVILGMEGSRERILSVILFLMSATILQSDRKHRQSKEHPLPNNLPSCRQLTGCFNAEPLSSFSHFTLSPRSRAVQTALQSNPSST